MNIKIFAQTMEESARDQIDLLAASPVFTQSQIRIMPDVHAGKGSVIGFTAHIDGSKIIPNVVGVDIGCGMFVQPLGMQDLDLVKLDRVIRKHIPCGFSICSTPLSRCDGGVDEEWLGQLLCGSSLGRDEVNRAIASVGTLGGGNHFIEVDRDEGDNKYLVIHSGSRNLGKLVAEHYQKLAEHSFEQEQLSSRTQLITNLKAQHREKEIAFALRDFDNQKNKVVFKDLLYLEGQLAQDYFHDMLLCMEYARLNREAIMRIILANYGLEVDRALAFHTVHNYIQPLSDGTWMVRKGAISAQESEKVFIPLNMRDGAVIALGRGNADWNYSAPHGAGRCMSRRQALAELTLEEYKEAMRGIYSTTVTQGSLDESPMAYKDGSEILSLLASTAVILHRLRPLYNFKDDSSRGSEKRGRAKK